MTSTDPLNARRPLPGVDGVDYFALAACDEAGIDTAQLPYTVRVLLDRETDKLVFEFVPADTKAPGPRGRKPTPKEENIDK